VVYWALHCVHTYLKPTINNFYVLYKIATVGQHQCDIITAPFVIVIENFWQGSAKNIGGLLVNLSPQSSVQRTEHCLVAFSSVYHSNCGGNWARGDIVEGVEVHMCFFFCSVCCSVWYESQTSAFGGI